MSMISKFFRSSLTNTSLLWKSVINKQNLHPLLTDFHTKLVFVRLDQKNLPMTNTVAYYENP